MLDSSLRAYAPLLGETAWHSLTVDSTIEAVSREHFEQIQQVLTRHWVRDVPPCSFLEVAAYAHTTGYLFQEAYDGDVALLDISASTLRLGRRLAAANGRASKVRLYAADFHYLPFEDNEFDVVYMSASLHHTWRWRQVLSEMQRVVAPGGLLVLNREPCARLCCLYRFRTNRIDAFTPFEEKLHEFGILRTIAEPFLGSRPETMFGMIENQTIPIEELVSALDGPTEIIEENLEPEATMSHVDQAWVGLFREKPEEALSVIRTHFVSLCHQASSEIDPVSLGLGYSLPSESEQEALVERVGEALGNLASSEHSAERQRQLSSIFGANTNFIVRKRPADDPVHLRKTTVREVVERPDVIFENGVHLAFAPSIAKLLIQPKSLLPDIQTASPESLEEFFDPRCWYPFTDNGITTLTLYNQPGRLRLKGQAPSQLLVLRFYGLPPEKGGCALVSLWRNGVEIFSHRVWQQESFLCAVRLDSVRTPNAEELVIHCLTGDGTFLNNNVNVSVAGLYDLT